MSDCVELQATIARIQRMEQHLDEVLYAKNTCPASMYEEASLKAKLQELTHYYENGQWLQDYDCDARGELPPDLKRGVLSQDTLYDLLCEIKKEQPMIREITEADFDGLMKLYMQLHGNPMPDKSEQIMDIWNRILADKAHHIIVAEEDGQIVSSCVCVIVPNLTHGQQPYALIENVVTDERFRNRGLATSCLDYAKELALRENCYKMMLLTGSKQESTLRFYERAGYNKNDKTAFIQWL